ncbi:uncharacterized protein LY79DRAFT_259210 [Colletotrichum navitas]|uniref:RING-type domain-containing protein n=1 Tax=Colletotrichum navitas TaxID=681940 RepID=A0AAD8V3L1_9PEZI|nr:uncharacterized protein LY79DRAFT_259210 [Colletotrichum navitas]KAK1585937.1 hypothetical protein LY79DRAFT_259210 [Colletotrichum navitas]
MEEFGIILVAIFMVLLACGLLHRSVRLTYIRVRDHSRYHPRASQFLDARRNLSTVTECTSACPEKQDLESGLNRHDAEQECPICIEPLFLPNNTNVTGAQPMHVMPSQIPGGAAGVPSVEGSGRQTWPTQHMTGDASEDRNAKPAASKWEILVGRLWGKSPVKTCTKLSDDDILTLKGCQHAFHAKCLSSWFLIHRYDCPVCRNPYWQSREEKARVAHAPPGLGPGPGPGLGGGDDEPGITRPAPARSAIARLAMPVL